MTDTFSQNAIKPEGLEQLNALWGTFDALMDATHRLGEIGGEAAQRQTKQLEERVEAFEPTVTLIGQIKAGKTALMNAMIGQPGFLPSDVNPWTSVVTSIHLNSRRRPENTRALFRFFDEDEWDRLVSTGGRLGELAARVGFEDEQAEIRDQVAAMREKSRARLGKRFELLLGTSHRYDAFNSELIDRYVCHGGWEEDDDATQGRFADITKMANLYLDLEGYPTGLCLRDTPGVNDTFMMREQITINAIRDSRICVVVLSAHQALSSMDLALLRLIANVDPEDVILFVNRIDELDDPARQVPEIAESFRSTFRRHNIPDGIDIMFGSALWALQAQSDDLDSLPAGSWSAMHNWADASSPLRQKVSGTSARDFAWSLSGVPELHRRIAHRIIEGPGRSMLRDTRDELSNIVTSIETAERGISLRGGAESMRAAGFDKAALETQLEGIEQSAIAALRAVSTEQVSLLNEQLEHAQSRFSERAVDALMSHIEAYGNSEPWTYEPAALRMMMRSAYKTFGSQVDLATQEVFADTCMQLAGLYQRLFDADDDLITIHPPALARLLPPAVVGKTIVLDLSASWWKKWWRGFRRNDAIIEEYRNLIVAETTPIISDLTEGMASTHCQANEDALIAFLKGQKASLAAVISGANGVAEGTSASDAQRALDTSRKLIQSLAA